MNMAAQRTGAVRKFFDHWRVYQKIVGHNYAAHHQMYDALHHFLVRYFQRSFVLLDCGCGDAGFMARALAETSVAAYQGVDVSAMALNLARKNMKAVACRKVFIGDDFSRVAQQSAMKADVIWIGLAFHHLSFPQKARCFTACRRILGTQGYLLIFDPFRQDAENRAGFIRRWEAVARDRWTALTKAESIAIRKHVHHSDFPESPTGVAKPAYRHWFTPVQTLCAEPTGIYQLIYFHA